jgi:hypothetical protein
VTAPGVHVSSRFDIALNGWLQCADGNYVSGRHLWWSDLFLGACNLLWLATEQMVKLLILEHMRATLDQGSRDLDAIHRTLGRAAQGIDRNHRRVTLTAALAAELPHIDLAPYEAAMDKLQEFYMRRYVVHSGTSIRPELIHQIDHLYFHLRAFVPPSLGLGLIDEIGIRNKHGWGHPLPAYRAAHHDNRAFRRRGHYAVIYRGPDGVMVKEDGSS